MAGKDDNLKTEHTEKLQKEFQSENNHLREQQRSVRMELDTKEKKIQELNMAVNSSKSLNEKLQGRLALLHNNEKLKEKLQHIEKEEKQKDELNDEIEEELHRKEKEIQHLQTECEMLRKELSAETNQITLIHEQMEALRKELVLAKKERHILKVKLDEMNVNVDEK